MFSGVDMLADMVDLLGCIFRKLTWWLVVSTDFLFMFSCAGSILVVVVCCRCCCAQVRISLRFDLAGIYLIQQSIQQTNIELGLCFVEG